MNEEIKKAAVAVVRAWEAGERWCAMGEAVRELREALLEVECPLCDGVGFLVDGRPAIESDPDDALTTCPQCDQEGRVLP